MLYTDAIDKLETRGLSLNTQCDIIQEVRSKIMKIPGSRGAILQKKTDEVFSKNSGFVTLQVINTALVHGDLQISSEISRNPAVLSAYTYAPLVSVDVERSFSDYKYILSDRRQSFTQENLEKHMIVLFNQRFL